MDFFYKYKKIIFFILFLLFAAFLGFILFSMFSSTSPTPGDQSGSGPTTGGQGFPQSQDGQGNIIDPLDPSNLPDSKNPNDIAGPLVNDIANGGLTKTTNLNDQPGSNFTSSSDGKSIQYYNKMDGKFYKLDKDGNLLKLSDKVFYQVESVAWSNSKDKAVIEYPDGANIVYDFANEKQITLPKHWEEFEFSPDDKEIVSKSMGLDPENRWLTVSSVDGSNARYIEPLGNNADKVYSSWSPNNQTVAMFTEGIDLDRQEVFFVGKNQENFKSTIIQGRGFQSRWSPDGTRLLYSVYSNNSRLKPSLWVVNAQSESIGSDRKNLGLETWAEKCNFTSARDVYCAVPSRLEEGAGLFPELANSTTDVIYKINVTSGSKKLISIPNGSFTISDIVVSDDEKTLYFADKRTGLVHKIDM